MSSIVESGIYNGVRGKRFQNMIKGLLKRGNLSTKQVERFTDVKSMAVFDQAFTSASANETVNYEMYEQLGDVTANKFIVWYMYRRFPQLLHPLGVKVVARLRINYGARQSFCKIGEELGFWDFISASEEDRGRKKKDLLEDCVESIVGAIEMLVDNATRPGVGNAVVYDILKSVFDSMHISLKYEDLYDSKTRIKELFDFHKLKLGALKYQHTRDPENGIFTSKAVISDPKHVMNGSDRSLIGVIGVGTATKLKDAEQKAATIGLLKLNRYGFVKPVPKEYEYFNNI